MILIEFNELISKIDKCLSENNYLEAREILSDIKIDYYYNLENLWILGKKMWKSGLSYKGLDFLRASYNLGNRNYEFLTDFLSLLSGERQYDEVLIVKSVLEYEGLVEANSYINYFSANAKLVKGLDFENTLARIEGIENSDKWLVATNVLKILKHALENQIPYSLIRLGDGEAKYTVFNENLFRNMLTSNEADVLINQMWHNWFGYNFYDVEKKDTNELWNLYSSSIDNSDIIGISESTRLKLDSGHRGFLLSQERFLKDKNINPFYTSSFIHFDLSRITYFLDDLIKVTDSICVISPHKNMAGKLAKLHSKENYLDIVIPGERRLPSHLLETSNHFPDVFNDIRKIFENRPAKGLYLVAAGLLGKVYCDMVKKSGGVAVDIGSIVDGWSGIYSTRPGQMDDIKTIPDSTS